MTNGATATFTGLSFESASAGENGGVFCLTGYSSLSVGDAEFQDNTGSRGAAIYANTASIVHITNTAMTSNSVQGNGGAIFGASESTLYMTDSSFTANSCSGAGGALWCVLDEFLVAYGGL